MSEIQTQIPDEESSGSAGNVPATEASGTSKVIEKLDAVVMAAEEENMGTSELIGLLFFYSHNLAQEARDAAIKSELEEELAKSLN